MTDDDVRMLVSARRRGQGIATFPGVVPETLDKAYAIQMRANAQWGDSIAGWKVGRINPPLDALLGANRFIGAVFAGSVIAARDGEVVRFPIIHGGFNAFEAELVMVLGTDAGPHRCDWDAGSARTLVSAHHLGVEVAGSPIADIQSTGPTGSIAAFGNNSGMILGPPVPGWREIDVDGIACSVSIDGTAIALRAAGTLPGGPFAALAFALNKAAMLGQPVRAGQSVLTGAITGVHAVRTGQRCTADFGDCGQIECETIAYE